MGSRRLRREKQHEVIEVEEEEEDMKLSLVENVSFSSVLLLQPTFLSLRLQSPSIQKPSHPFYEDETAWRNLTTVESSVKEMTDNQGSHSKCVSNVAKLSRVRSGKGSGR